MNPYVAEAVGTMMLILLGDGVVANVVLERTKGQNSGWIVITVGWGVAVAMAVYAVGRISGAHLNPAVTVGLAAIGSFPWAEVAGYIAAQMVGAFLGAVLVWLTYLPHWRLTADPGAKLAVFCTGPAIRNPARTSSAEVIGTAVLLFGVLAIAANAQTLASRGTSICRSCSAAGCSRCWSACSCSASACRSAARPATRSIRRAIWDRASRTRSCRFPARARRTGSTRGFPSSGRSSAAWSARDFTF